MNTSIPTWIFLALCLCASFLLSGMEAGVFALNRLRVRRLARAGKPSAKLLHGFLERPENFLWTILVGNTLANFLILGWTLLKLRDWLRGHEVWIAAVFAAAVFLFYALFDLLPKMFFRAHPNPLCLSAAPVFRFVHVVLSLPVWIVEKLSTALLHWTGGRAFTGRLFGSREEMRSVMQESAQALTSDERAMINRVLDLQNFTVRQIATPLAQDGDGGGTNAARRGVPAGARTAVVAAAGPGNARRPSAHRRAARARPAAVPRRSGFAKARRRAHDARAVCE